MSVIQAFLTRASKLYYFSFMRSFAQLRDRDQSITGNVFIIMISMVRAGNPRYECTLQVACEFPKRKDRLLWESSANSLNGRTDERIRKPVGTAAADFPQDILRSVDYKTSQIYMSELASAENALPKRL